MPQGLERTLHVQRRVAAQPALVHAMRARQPIAAGQLVVTGELHVINGDGLASLERHLEPIEPWLDAINATVIAIDRPTARLAAELRGRHRSLRLPDALSLAAAIAANAELLTLDTRLIRIQAHEKQTP